MSGSYTTKGASSIKSIQRGKFGDTNSVTIASVDTSKVLVNPIFTGDLVNGNATYLVLADSVTLECRRNNSNLEDTNSYYEVIEFE